MLMLMDNTLPIYTWVCPRCGNEEPAEYGEDRLECACDLALPPLPVKCDRKQLEEQKSFAEKVGFDTVGRLQDAIGEYMKATDLPELRQHDGRRQG